MACEIDTIHFLVYFLELIIYAHMGQGIQE